MKRYLTFPFLLIGVHLLTGCYTAIEQQFHYGNYDSVVLASLEKMKRPRKRDQFLDMAVRAYSLGMKDKKQRISFLKPRNEHGQNWEEIYSVYASMDDMQSAIEPYLPLRYSDGKKAEVEFYDLTAVLEEARSGAAEYQYDNAVEWLSQGTKAGGRNAYAHLQNIRRYYGNAYYRNEIELRDRAIEMGTNKVLILFKPASDLYLPDSYLGELSWYDYENMLGDWTRLYREAVDSLVFDYVIELRVEVVQVGPEHIKEVHYQKLREVEDGVRPVLDANGEIVVDSSGNVVQAPHYTTLACYVTEWSQRRTASVFTAFEIINADVNRVAVRQRLEDHVVFENTYARANGHLNILPPEIIALTNNHPRPFPTDHEMILLTAESLRRQIADAIHRNGDILASAN